MNNRAALLVLAGPLFFTAAMAYAEIDNDEVIARVYFEPRTYELYREWAVSQIKRLEALGPHERRIQLGRTYWPGDSKDVELIKAILSEPAVFEDTGNRYVLTIARRLVLRGRDPEFLLRTPLVDWIIEGFNDDVRGDPTLYEAKRAEHDVKIKELKHEMGGLESRIEEVNRKAEQELRKVGSLNARARMGGRIRELEDTLLGMQMDLAEREAKRKVMLEKLQEEGERAQTRDALLDEQRVLLQRQLEVAQRSLEEAKRMAEMGRVSPNEVAAAELRLLEVEQDQLRLKAQPQEEPNTALRLRELLVETEVELAGIEARMKIAEEQKEHLESLRNLVWSFEHERAEARARIEELERQIEELDWPKGPKDFPIARPIIEWVEQSAEEK